jgi:hypothetical protein
MGLAIFFLLTGFIHLLPIPKLPLFYGNAAMIIAFSGFLAVLVRNITRMPPGLWSLLCIVLGRFLKKSAAVYGCALLYPVQALAAFFYILRTGGHEAGEITGLFPAGEPLVFINISFFFLPPLLLLMRGNALSGEFGGEEKPREDAGGSGAAGGEAGDSGATSGYSG